MLGFYTNRARPPSTAGTPDGAPAPATAPPPRSSIVSNPAPAAPRAASAPHRSSAEPSPQTPPGNPQGSVICHWQRGDMFIGRLHGDIAETHVLPFPFRTLRCRVRSLRERSDRCRMARHRSCPDFSEPVVAWIYSVRLDQPSHRRRHRGSRRSSSWPYPTTGTRCGWRDPPADLRDRSGGMR